MITANQPARNHRQVHGLLMVLCLLMLPVAWAWAQMDIQPPLNPDPPPPDLTQPPGFPPGFAPPPPAFPPDPAIPPTFQPFPDDDFGGFDGFDGGSDRSGVKEGKSSFILVEPTESQGCKAWGNAIMGSRVFEDFHSCRFELQRTVEKGQRSIDMVTDKTERYKLRHTIRGELSQQQAQQYKLTFPRLTEDLNEARRTGCQCMKP